MTINRVVLGGRLAKDPEIRKLNGGLTACRLTLATEHTSRSKDGQTKKEVCYIEATVWNKTADLCAQSLKKGSLVTIEGRLKQEKWMDKTSNVERTKHVIVPDNVLFMEPKAKTQEPGYEPEEEWIG